MPTLLRQKHSTGSNSTDFDSRLRSIRSRGQRSADYHLPGKPRWRRGRSCDAQIRPPDRNTFGWSVLAEWPVYRCLVYQLESDDYLDVLTGGQWFRVDLDYKKRIYARVAALDQLAGCPMLTPAQVRGRITKRPQAPWAPCVSMAGCPGHEGPDKMELCDILTRRRRSHPRQAPRQLLDLSHCSPRAK